MKYQTIIEIFTEAENESDAMDIAGEFLRGNLDSGVLMKCRTKPCVSVKVIRSSVLVSIIVVLTGIASAGLIGHIKHKPMNISGIESSSISAIQPPLKTKNINNFSKNWTEEENKRILQYIKSSK